MEINFIDIKYNLYEILNVDIKTPNKEIKNNFNIIIKKFHPDKTSIIEMEIYYHLILAKKILLDNELKEKYNNFIFKKEFNELKTEHINNPKIEEIDNRTFYEKEKELNELHGYNCIDKIDNSGINLNKITEKRNNDFIEIDKIPCKNINEFNNIFKYTKKIKNDNEKIQTEIQIYKPLSSTNYTNINNISKLYETGTVENELFCSLDKAFE